MTNITVIGTSHVGALRAGWDLISKDFPEVSMSFFAISVVVESEAGLTEDFRFGQLNKISGHPTIWRATERLFGATSVDLSAADVVIYAGFNLNQFSNIAFLSKYAVDGVHEATDHPRVSESCYAAICDAFLDAVLTDPAWHNWTEKKLYVMDKPRRSEAILDDESDNPGMKSMFSAESKIDAKTLSYYVDRATARLAKLGINLISPPDHVYGDTGLTLSKYARGGVMPFKNTGTAIIVDDYNHMNGEYGAIMLRQTLASIVETAARPEQNSVQRSV